MRSPIPLLLLLLPAATLAACIGGAPQPTAVQDFAANCVGCHGEGGRGDGPLAAGLSPRPADLARIAARNGGAFPMTRVMSVIDGYSRGRHAGAEAMPEFGEALAEGRRVLYDDGRGGPPVPVPERLIELARYLASLQE